MTRQEAVKLVDQLFQDWYPSLFRYLLRATQSVELAEDLAQQSFMDLYRELARGRKVENPKAWTLCVARRHLQRQMREQARRDRGAEPVEAMEPPPARSKNPEEQAEYLAITAMFSSLSRREEEVLLLRLEGLKYREIAAQLGISPNSVSTLLVRALAKLKAWLNAEAPPKQQHRAVVKRGQKALH